MAGKRKKWILPALRQCSTAQVISPLLYADKIEYGDCEILLGGGKLTFQFSGREKEVFKNFSKLDAVAIEELIGKDVLQNSGLS